MANIKLDLAGFKHVSSDDKSTTLKHEKLGHSVTLAHNVLSPDNQKVLKALSKSQEPVKQEYGKIIRKAEGGKVPVPGREADAEHDKQLAAKEAGSASRGERNTQASKIMDYISNPSSIVDRVSNAWAEGGKVKMAEGGEPESPERAKQLDEDLKRDDRPSLGQVVAEAWKHAIGPDKARPADQPIGHMGSDFGDSDKPAPTPKPEQAPEQNPPGIMADAQGKAAQAVQNPPQEQSAASQDQSVAPAAPIQAAAARPVAPAAPGNLAAIPTASTAPQDYSNLQPALKEKYIAEDQAFQHDLNNGHITPKTYSSLFAEKSTLGKIGSIFGMLMSGAGSGLAHQPNMAMQMMENIIQRDLDAQKTSKNNAENFKKIEMDRLMQQANIQHLAQTNQLTKAQVAVAMKDLDIKSDALAQTKMTRAALHQLTENLKTMQPGTPQYEQAKNALAMVANQVDLHNANIADKASAMSALLGGMGGPGNSESSFKNKTQALRMSGQKDLAEDLERKHLAGEDEAANRPIETHDREKLLGHDKLESGLKDLAGSLDELATYNHYSPKYIKMVEKIQKLQSDIRESALGTVYREGEQPLLDKILKTPAGNMDKYQTKTQINELRNINHRDAGVIKGSYGIKSKDKAPDSGMIIVNKKTGQRMQLVDGKWTPIK